MLPVSKGIVSLSARTLLAEWRSAANEETWTRETKLSAGDHAVVSAAVAAAEAAAVAVAILVSAAEGEGKTVPRVARMTRTPPRWSSTF